MIGNIDCDLVLQNYYYYPYLNNTVMACTERLRDLLHVICKQI